VAPAAPCALARHLGHTGQTRKTWIFRRTGGQTQLLSQLARGGYERFSLHRRDATTWVGRKRGLGVYCRRLGRYLGYGEQSVSIHITTSTVVSGVLTATAVEAYYRENYHSDCGGKSFSASGKYRLDGNRADLGG
jgi:hypothetical protein